MALRILSRSFSYTVRRSFWSSSAKPEGEKEDVKVEKEPEKPEEPEPTPDTDATVNAKAQAKPEKSAHQIKIEQLEAELAKSKQQTLVVLADTDNMRKRMLKERENEKTYAISKFATELLDVSDNLARAIEAIPEEYRSISDDVEGIEKVLKDIITGVSMTSDIMAKTLKKFGVEEYNPMGEKFDTNWHEALYTFPDAEKPNNSVGNVIQTGYVIADRVLRVAKVGIVQNK